MNSKAEGRARYTDMPVASVTIVVACFNDAAEIEPLCARLLPLLKELASDRRVQLLCIDDGSDDDTLAMLRKYFEHAPGVATDIVSHPRHLGTAEVMRTAFSASRGDIVCVLEGNLRYGPEALGGMLDLLER